MVDEEGRALLLRSLPTFETALDFGRYHHVFRVVHLLQPPGEEACEEYQAGGADATPEVVGVVLVALRSTFTCEIIGEAETAAYAGAIGCPVHLPVPLP
jgi:hypothetical protein